LNNPLKYTDPSGHDVEICGINLETTPEQMMILLSQMSTQQSAEFVALLEAWTEFSKAAPKLTADMLESNQIISIEFDPNTGQGGTNWDKGFESNGNMTITLGSSLINDSEFLVCTLAHESFHAGNNLRPAGTTNFEDWGQSLWDESFAFGFGNAVGQKLGYNMTNIYTQNGYYNSCAGMNPFTYTGSIFYACASNLSSGAYQNIKNSLWGNHILDILAKKNIG
jgi:hypothetical protein